jgi:hypothetical protein
LCPVTTEDRLLKGRKERRKRREEKERERDYIDFFSTV